MVVFENRLGKLLKSIAFDFSMMFSFVDDLIRRVRNEPFLFHFL